MDNRVNGEAQSTSIKKLTVAVWILGILVLASLFITAFPLLFRQAGTNATGIERQIMVATLIVETTWRAEDGRQKCIISGILKRGPGIPVYFKVGDEYRPGSQISREGTDYGEGQILFFTGSPPSFQSSVTYSDGRLIAFGDMPVEELRKLIKASAEEKKG